MTFDELYEATCASLAPHQDEKTKPIESVDYSCGLEKLRQVAKSALSLALGGQHAMFIVRVPEPPDGRLAAYTLTWLLFPGRDPEQIRMLVLRTDSPSQSYEVENCIIRSENQLLSSMVALIETSLGMIY